MICFCWVQLPQYAARCIGALVRSTSEKIVVVATRPKVPIEGMDEVCQCEIHWLDDDCKGKSLVEIVTAMAEDYEIRWRCWSKEPTYEQREMIPWMT